MQSQEKRTFTESMNLLIQVIELAQKRGAYSLQESSVVFQTIQNVNNNPDVQALLLKDKEAAEKKTEKVEEI